MRNQDYHNSLLD
jgi:hypothetical protein